MRYRAYKKVSRQCQHWRQCQRHPHQKQYVPLPFGGVISTTETKSMLVKHNDSQKMWIRVEKKKKESQPTDPDQTDPLISWKLNVEGKLGVQKGLQFPFNLGLPNIISTSCLDILAYLLINFRNKG